MFASALFLELFVMGLSSGFQLDAPKSCTDYHLLAPASLTSSVVERAWGHTEDNEPQYEHLSYRVEADLGDFRYVGFTYAPNPVGWAWGFTSHGLAQSVNALVPATVTIGIGVNFLARDVLNAVSLDEAVKRACVSGLASGQTFNLGSIHEKDRQLVVETSPWGCSVKTLAPPAEAPPTVGFHTNKYEHRPYGSPTGTIMSQIDMRLPQLYPSSVKRMARMAALAPAASVQELQAVLSNKEDTDFPIHRNGAPPDNSATMNTVIFDVAREKVLVWGKEAPTECEPAIVYDWRGMETLSKAREDPATTDVLV